MTDSARSPNGTGYRALSELIEATRVARNLTPAEASRQAGVPPTQFARWRHGQGGVSMRYLAKLALWMDIPLHVLQPMAGFPVEDRRAQDAPDTEIEDPRLSAVASAWERLTEARRAIIHEIATHVPSTGGGGDHSLFLI